MGLLRLLLLIALALIAWRVLARALLPTAPAPPRGGADYLPLTRCKVCGAHIPQPENGAAPVCERCRSH